MTAAYSLFDALFDRVRELDLSGNRLTRVGLSILSALRGARPVRVEVSGNVQTAQAGDAPIVMSDVLDGVTETLRLRQQIANPRHRTDGA